MAHQWPRPPQPLRWSLSLSILQGPLFSNPFALCLSVVPLGIVLSTQESRSRQLSLQNETMLFELARLQNALLHSVPIHQHNRLLREHKKLLRDRFLSPTDGGYHSAEDEEEENIAEELYAGQQLNIGRAAGRNWSEKEKWTPKQWDSSQNGNCL